MAASSGSRLGPDMRRMADGLIALRTESATRDLVDPLSALIRTYAMRESGRTVLVAAAALDGNAIHPRNGTFDYSLSLMLSVEHPSTRTVEQVDTVLAFSTPSPMTKGQVANVRVVTPAQPAADATVRFTVRNTNDPRQGQMITTAREIPDYAGNRFALVMTPFSSSRIAQSRSPRGPRSSSSIESRRSPPIDLTGYRQISRMLPADAPAAVPLVMREE